MKKQEKAKQLKKKISLQDLKKADMDPVLQFRMKQKSSVPMIITGSDRMVIRKFARENLQTAKMRNPDMDLQTLINNLEASLKRLKPEMRKIVMEQMRKQVDEK